MEKRSIIRILVGIVFLAFGACLLWATFQCLHDCLFPKPLCGGSPEPKWEVWIFKLPFPLSTFFPDVAFMLAGIAWIRRSSCKFVWAFIGGVTFLTIILVHDSRISNAIWPQALRASQTMSLNTFGIILGIGLLVFVLFALWKKDIRVTLLRKKFLIAAIILCQLAILFGWHRVGAYVYIEKTFSAPFFETSITDVIDLKEDWGALETREVAFYKDYNTGDQQTHILRTAYIFRVPAAASVEPVQNDKYLRVKFANEGGNLCSFLLTKIKMPPRYPCLFICRPSHTSESIRWDAVTSGKDFSFFDSARDNADLIRRLDSKAGLFDGDESDGTYYVYTTGYLSCIKRKTSFNGTWYSREGMIVEIKKENGERSFTPQEMKVVHNIIASIRIVQEPQENIATD